MIKSIVFSAILASVFGKNIVFPNFSFTSRIINGETATQGQFPYQVGIFAVTTTGENAHFCSGAIISEQWILTSGHCLYETGYLGIIPSLVNMDNMEDFFRVLAFAKNYTIHEEYNSTTLENDIGLILLESELIFDENTQPISLGETKLESGINATVTGWGSDNNNPLMYIDDLQYAVVTTLENSACGEIYGDYITEKIVCAIGENPVKNPCFNDGGAPLVTSDFVHVGIFSFLSNQGCEDEGYPAGYTRTASYRDWIKEKTGV